jgi:hypothetical protein
MKEFTRAEEMEIQCLMNNEKSYLVKLKLVPTVKTE